MINPNNFFVFAVLCCVSFLLNCGFEDNDFLSLPKIDAHVHVRTFDPTFVAQAMADHFQLLTICTKASSRLYIDEQIKFAKHNRSKFPQAVFFATTFSMEDWGGLDWQNNVIERLKGDFEQGAIAVKVWKDIGMTFRDSGGNFIMIDDASFDPILDFIASQGRTLVAHIGEPRNCWLPLDSMTVNNDRNYFKKHPEYHMYLHQDYPSYEDQIAARDRMLEKHPDLKVVGAHLGSLEWNVDELAERLDRFPNFAVDMAARICHFQVQDRNKVRNFITKYQDRLLYGTDLGVSEDSNMYLVKKRMHETWLADWKYFTSDEEMTSKNINGTFCGLKLNKIVLRKIYYENAKRWYPGIGS